MDTLPTCAILNQCEEAIEGRERVERYVWYGMVFMFGELSLDPHTEAEVTCDLLACACGDHPGFLAIFSL